MPLAIKSVRNRLFALLVAAWCSAGGGAVRAQQAATAPPAEAQPKANNAEFSAAADEVLQQVSEILECSEPAVKTSLFRATKKLRLNLARYEKRTAKESGPQDLNSHRLPVITLRGRQALPLR